MINNDEDNNFRQKDDIICLINCLANAYLERFSWLYPIF